MAARCLATQGNKVLVLNYFGTYEPALKIRMDHTGTLRSFRARTECPRAYLITTCCQERTEVKQRIRSLDQPVNTRLLQADLLEEHLPLLIGLQFGYLALYLRSHHQHLSLLIFHRLAHLLNVLVAADRRAFVHVADVQHRFVRQQKQVVCRQFLFFVLQLNRTCRFALRQRVTIADIQFQSHLRLFVATYANLLLYLLYPALNGLQILELQFGIDHLFVTNRINTAVHMNHVAVVKAPQHMNDSIRLTDIGEELVSQTLTVACALHQARYIHNLHRGRYNAALGVTQLAQLVQPLVRNGYNAQVGFDRTKWKIG